MKRYLSLLLISLLFLCGCSTLAKLDKIDKLEEKINALEQKTNINRRLINKIIIPLSGDDKAPEGSTVLESPFSPKELFDAMAGGERAVYIRAFTGLTGGSTGDLDKIANSDLDDNDLGLVFDVQGDYSAGAMLMYYWDEDTDVSELVPRYIESDTDGGTSGTWILMNGWTGGPTATPSMVFRDSDAAGTDEWDDLLAGRIQFNLSVVTEGAEITDWFITAMVSGSEVNILEWDGDGEVLTMGDSSTGEDLYFDFETATDNEVEVRSNSGVTQIDWGTLAFLTGNITVTGTVTTTGGFVPNTSDGAAVGSIDLEISDIYLADSGVIYGGDDQDVSLTHVPDTGFLISSSMQWQFRNSSMYINSAADGHLDVNATNIDLNGTVNISGNVTGLTPYVIIGNCEGAHDGAGDASTLSDSGESLTVDAYIGMTVYNITDGSSCTVTDNDATTITCTLSGGTDNDWDVSDVWQVGPGPNQSGSVFYISAATTIAHPATAGYVAGYFAAAAQVIKIDPYSVSMTINFSDDGTFTDPGAGDEIDSDGTQGDFIWIHNSSATEAYSHGVNGSWADGGAS